MKSIKYVLYFLSGSILFSVPPAIYGQGTVQTIVSGQIADGHTREPLPYANIVFENSNVGTISNIDGSFKITNTNSSKIIHITSVGYEPLEIEILIGKTQTINVMMKTKITELGEVVVKKGKFQYKNKNNPAVEIIENVIKHKDLNRSENLSYLAYDKYQCCPVKLFRN